MSGRATEGNGGSLTWSGSLTVDVGGLPRGGVLPDGHMFTSLDLELSASLTVHFALSSSSVSDFSALTPFVSQSKPLHVSIQSASLPLSSALLPSYGSGLPTALHFASGFLGKKILGRAQPSKHLLQV